MSSIAMRVPKDGVFGRNHKIEFSLRSSGRSLDSYPRTQSNSGVGMACLHMQKKQVFAKSFWTMGTVGHWQNNKIDHPRDHGNGRKRQIKHDED